MVIEEKYSGYWIQITAALAVGTLLFLIGFNLIDDILWKGILRLVAFGFLAGTVFSTLKVMQGKHTIKFETENGELILSYFKKNQTISRDVFELKSIGEVYHEPHDLFLWKSFFLKGLNIKFIPTDSDRPLNLVEVHGRPLALSEDDARRIIEFLETYAPNAQISNHK